MRRSQSSRWLSVSLTPVLNACAVTTPSAPCAEWRGSPHGDKRGGIRMPPFIFTVSGVKSSQLLWEIEAAARQDQTPPHKLGRSLQIFPDRSRDVCKFEV